MAINYWEWLEMSEKSDNGWEWAKITENGWKWLEFTGMAGNG